VCLWDGGALVGREGAPVRRAGALVGRGGTGEGGAEGGERGKSACLLLERKDAFDAWFTSPADHMLKRLGK
jgi:hypothetical protein